MTEQEQQMMQQQMMQQQGQQGAPSQEEQMMQQQQMQQQQAPQQGGQDEGMQQIMQFVQQAISQGMEPLEVAQLLLSKQVPPEVIMQVFVQVGLPEADAQTVIQQAMTSGEAEAGAEQPMQEGEPMPPEGQPSEQPMPPQEQPPMGRGGMMYAEKGMAVNNEELDTIMSQVQEMLAQPNADIRVIMQEIQKAAQAGQISPETATTVLETLQQNMPSQTEPTQGMPSEEEMYAQQQMMQEQGQAGLARFGGNLRKLLKKAAGGSTNFPDDTSENYGEERTNSFLDAVKGNFFNAQLDDAAQQFPSLNGYAYGGEIMADTNMYADGGELCPPCPDGSVVERLPDGNCPCIAQQVPNTVLTPATQTTPQQTNTDAGMQAIDQLLLNPGSGNTVLTPGATSNNTQLEKLLRNELNGSLSYGDFNAKGNVDFVNHAAGLNLAYAPKTGLNFDLGTSVDKAGTTKRNLGLGYNFVDPFGIAKSKLGLNTYMNYSNLADPLTPKGIIGAVNPVDDPTKYDPKTVVGIKADWSNGNWGAKADLNSGTGFTGGLDYNFKPEKGSTAPAVKLGLQYQNNLGLDNSKPTPTPGPGLALGGRALVQAVDGISMKDGKLVVDPSQYKDADSYELAYRRWNADPKNAKFLVDPKTNPYKTVTPYTFKDTDPGIVMFEGTPRINPAKYKTDAEYKAAIFDWNKKNKGTANVIDVDKISDFIPLPPEKEKEKKVEFQDGKKYTYDAKTQSWAEDLGTPALNFSATDWASFTQPQRDAMNLQQKQLDAFKKNIENVTNQGIQPVGYNQPNAAFLNPWARFFMGGMEGNQGVKTNVNNLPPGFDLNTSLKAGMRGETVGEDGKKYAWRVTSQEQFKKRVPGLFNNERGVRLNIEWGDADDKGNIIKKDNGNNTITPEKVVVASDTKDPTKNVVVLDPKNDKKNNGTGLYQSQNMEIFDANGNVIIPGVNTASTGNQTVTSTTPAAGTTPAVVNNQVVQPTGQGPYLNGYADPILNQYGPENMPQGYVNPAVNYNQNIPNGMMIKYGTDKDGNPIGIDRKGRFRGNNIERQFAPIDATVPIEVPVQPNNYLQWNPMGVPPIQNQPNVVNSSIQPITPMYESNPGFQFNTPSVYQDNYGVTPYSEDPNIPIGNAEMPFAFDNVQPSQQDVINAMQMQNKIKNRPFARGGNVYEIGGQPPCAAGEAVDPNTGLCMDASTLGVRNNEGNFRGMFKNMFNIKDPVVGPNRTVNKPIDPFKNLTATGSDDPNVMPKMPTISAMNAFNNSFGQRVDPNQQGSLSISDEKTWQQKANQRENLADGLYGTAGKLTNFFNKVGGIDSDMNKAYNSSLNQPLTAQSDQSKGLYADNGDLLADQIGNQVLNPTYSYGSEQIVASPGLTFSSYGGNIFEYGGNIYELGGDIELTDEEMQQLAASGFYFEPA